MPDHIFFCHTCHQLLDLKTILTESNVRSKSRQHDQCISLRLRATHVMHLTPTTNKQTQHTNKQCIWSCQKTWVASGPYLCRLSISRSDIRLEGIDYRIHSNQFIRLRALAFMQMKLHCSNLTILASCDFRSINKALLATASLDWYLSPHVLIDSPRSQIIVLDWQNSLPSIHHSLMLSDCLRSRTKGMII